jgi:hypothetical protein
MRVAHQHHRERADCYWVLAVPAFWKKLSRISWTLFQSSMSSS